MERQFDSNILDKLGQESKQLLFKVVFQMLKDEEQSKLLNGLFILIQGIQMLYIPFNHKIWEVWQNEKLSSQLNKLFGYFILTPFFDEDNFNSLITILYILLSLILLTFMIIFTIAYSQRQSYSWSIYILRVIISLFTTILFMPLMDLLLTLLVCQENQYGQMMLENFNILCWSNQHVVHGVVAIFGLIVSFLVITTFSLLYYDGRFNISEASSRKSGRPYVMILIYQLVMIICYKMSSQQLDHLMILVMIAGSFIILYYNHVEQPYNNKFIQKCWSIILCINTWTVLLLAFAKYLEGIMFFGLVYACLAGYPLITLYLVKSDKNNFDLLMININQEKNPNQIILMIDYVIKLLAQANQLSYLLLDGFLEIHRATCNRQDCYLKNSKSSRSDNPEMRNENVLQVVNQIYFNTIKRFPHDVQLRLKYIAFIFDQLKLRQQAINELASIDQLNPAMDYEFQVYRFKAIIEKELQDIQNQSLGNQDYISELTYQAKIRQFQNLIERATLMHMDFWSQLQEDNPDIGKMNEIGYKINQSVTQIEEMWTKMQRNSTSLPNIMRVYAKFMIDVLQDKEQGENMLILSKKLQVEQSKMKNRQQIQLISSEDISFESLPTIIAQTSSDKFGLISHINLASCNLFGYNKQEMINRKINMLMPNVFAKIHDEYMESYLNRQENRQVLKERLIYIKTKSTYIIPCLINLKILQQIDNNILIAAQFKQIKQTKPLIYILLDYENIIDSISASCISKFNIDSKFVQQRKSSIYELIPNFPSFNKMSQFKGKQGEKFQITLLSSQSNSTVIDDPTQTQQLQCQCQITDIQNIQQDQIQGCVVKLEPSQGDQSFNQDLNNYAHQSNFQFKFQPKNVYFGESSMGDTNSARVDNSIIWEQGDVSVFNNSEPQQFKQTVKSDTDDVKETNIINYAEGIRTLRLYDNRIQDVDERLFEISEEDEPSIGRSVFQNNQEVEENNLNDQNNVFKNRNNLKVVLYDDSSSYVVSRFHYAVTILFIIILVIIYVDFFITLNQNSQVRTVLDLLWADNLRDSYFSLIVASVQNLLMVNLGIRSSVTSTNSTFQYAQRQTLNQSINELDQISKKLMLSNQYLNDQLSELYTKNVVRIRSDNNQYQMYDMFQATQQLISRTMTIYNKNVSLLSMSDNDVSFVLYNIQNEFLEQSRNSCNLYAKGLYDTTTQKSQIFDFILGFSIGIIISGFLVILIFLLCIFQNQETILQMFLDIPERTIKYLYNKSENFISNLQIGENDEVISEGEEMEKNKNVDLSRSLKGKRKKKRYKNTNKAQRNYLFSMLIILIIFGAYFIFNYFSGQLLMLNIQQQVPEINVTAMAQGFYRFVDNAQRSLYLNRSQTILEKSSYDQVIVGINQLYQVDSQIHQEHALNSDVANIMYRQEFDRIFMTQPCDQLSTYQWDITLDACKIFADGAVYQGMAVALARYFENIRYMQTIYDQFWGFPLANFTAITKNFTTFRNITRNSDNVTNYIYNMNNYNQSREARTMQMSYIKGSFEILMSYFIDAIQADMNLFATQRLALFIVFQIFLFLVYFMLYLPLLMKLYKDLHRTRSMIVMIPLRVIINIKSIKEYIKELSHQNKVVK